MQLILHNAPVNVAERLHRQGWIGSVIGPAAPSSWTTLPDTNAAQQLPRPRLWICNTPTRPTASLGDIVLDLHHRSNQDVFEPGVLTLALQDSAFAVEHGFFIAVGGNANSVDVATPILDALAPQADGWLYAGGHLAPHFLAALVNEVGLNWVATAAKLAAAPLEFDITPWWQQQGATLARMAALSADYLQHEQDSDYRVRPDSINSFAFLITPGDNKDSPARKIANMLCWLAQQLAKNAES